MCLVRNLEYSLIYNKLLKHGDMMKLVDVTDSKSVDSDIVWVRVPLSLPPSIENIIGTYSNLNIKIIIIDFHYKQIVFYCA